MLFPSGYYFKHGYLEDGNILSYSLINDQNIYPQPFLATLFAIYLYHHDTLDLRKITAAVLIIFGVYLVSMPFKKTKS